MRWDCLCHARSILRSSTGASRSLQLRQARIEGIAQAVTEEVKAKYC